MSFFIKNWFPHCGDGKINRPSQFFNRLNSRLKYACCNTIFINNNLISKNLYKFADILNSNIYKYKKIGLCNIFKKSIPKLNCEFTKIII